MSSSASQVPLCVDLDGTLLRSDILWEAILVLLKKKPHLLFMLPVWFLRGRPYFKRQIATRVAVETHLLPYHPAFLEFLREEHAKGRKLVLATAADRIFAEEVAKHIGLFDADIIATDEGANLAGHHKAEILVKKFGEKGFDYAGNEIRDLKIWKRSRKAVVVNAPAHVTRKAGAIAEIDRVFDELRSTPRSLLRAMRPHQWMKNLLIFAPVVVSHHLTDMSVIRPAAIAFVAFCLCASSVYLLNDILDLASDRRHARKRNRPLASGRLSVPVALAVMPLLLILSIALALLLPQEFLWVLGIYFLCTVGYSFYFKSVMLIDVLLLAGLYTLRIVAGHAATELRFSFWLLLLAMFLFLSLALVKRYSELDALQKEDKTSAWGRAYSVKDITPIGTLGVVSGLMSVLIMALYINSPDVTLLYRYPGFLWLTLPVILHWTSRMWLLTYRGEMHDDPILFAVKDPTSYLAGILVIVVMTLAS
jgi:4-hydroxybenzoate polyprenyltransferase/phosphoserine phosphatase